MFVSGYRYFSAHLPHWQVLPGILGRSQTGRPGCPPSLSGASEFTRVNWPFSLEDEHAG